MWSAALNVKWIKPGPEVNWIKPGPETVTVPAKSSPAAIEAVSGSAPGVDSAASVSLGTVPVPVPFNHTAETKVRATVWVSMKLTSVKVSVPDGVSVSGVVALWVPASSVIGCCPEDVPDVSPDVSAASTGAAFGLIVIVINWLALAPKLSVSVIVSVSPPL